MLPFPSLYLVFALSTTILFRVPEKNHEFSGLKTDETFLPIFRFNELHPANANSPIVATLSDIVKFTILGFWLFSNPNAAKRSVSSNPINSANFAVLHKAAIPISVTFLGVVSPERVTSSGITMVVSVQVPRLFTIAPWLSDAIANSRFKLSVGAVYFSKFSKSPQVIFDISSLSSVKVSVTTIVCAFVFVWSASIVISVLDFTVVVIFSFVIKFWLYVAFTLNFDSLYIIIVITISFAFLLLSVLFISSNDTSPKVQVFSAWVFLLDISW